MEDAKSHNFKVYSRSLGPVYFSPQQVNKNEIEEAAIVVYPSRLSKGQINAAVEWAASTQIPVFSHSENIPHFEREGFGAYRFHRLDSYKEVDFLGGSMVFFPAKKPKFNGIRGLMADVKEVLGISEVPSFHVILKPRGEDAMLFLSSPQIDPIDWELLTKHGATRVVASAQYAKDIWERVAKRHAFKFEWAGEIESTHNARPATGEENEKAKAL